MKVDIDDKLPVFSFQQLNEYNGDDVSRCCFVFSFISYIYYFLHLVIEFIARKAYIHGS